MPAGRKPAGNHALSNAERQARYHVNRTGQEKLVNTRPRRPLGRGSRPQRRRDAVPELLAFQSGYADWFAALPESLRDSTTADALETIAELDLVTLTDIDLPRGYGRD